MPRLKSDRDRDRSRIYLGLGVVAVMLLIGATVGLRVVAGYYLPVLDSSMCPSPDRLAGEIVLILDSTDPWSPIRAQALQGDIRLIRERIPRFARLRVHVVKESADPTDTQAGQVGSGSHSSAVLTVCNPGSPEQMRAEVPKWLAWFITNPDRLEQRWEQEFASAVDDALKSVEKAQPQDHSPIMETIRAAAIAASDPNGPQILVLSDMYQNSDPSLPTYMRHGAPKELE